MAKYTSLQSMLDGTTITKELYKRVQVGSSEVL